jgi:hypothetical protein
MTRTEPPNEDRPVALLLLWAEAVADFVCLPPRLRARVLAQMAEDIRGALAAMPDKELIYPWQIRQVNQAFGFEVIPAPQRNWRVAPEVGVMRVIGE